MTMTTTAASTSQVLFIAVCVAILMVHYRFYAKVPYTTTVLQTTVTGLRSEMLTEKQPIVVEDRVVDPRELLSTVFRYSYLFSKHDPIVTMKPEPEQEPERTGRRRRHGRRHNGVLETRGVVTLVSPIPLPRHDRHSSSSRRCTRQEAPPDRHVLHVAPSSYTDRASRRKHDRNRGIDFVLHSNQVLILPPHWTVSASSLHTDDGGGDVRCSVVQAFDTFHALMMPIASFRSRMKK